MFSFAGVASVGVKKTGPLPSAAPTPTATLLVQQLPGVPGNHQVFIGPHDAHG